MRILYAALHLPCNKIQKSKGGSPEKRRRGLRSSKTKFLIETDKMKSMAYAIQMSMNDFINFKGVRDLSKRKDFQSANLVSRFCFRY